MVNNKTPNTNDNRVPGAAVGSKERFQQSASTHSEVGEKETLNINAVGKYILGCGPHNLASILPPHAVFPTLVQGVGGLRR